MKQARERIIILGGGMAGLSAAWSLTSAPDWHERYDVTVYQEGWLLGGKGASVRNRAHHDRIEEHGLHLWMGFYDNAFRVMREVYAELGRPAEAPLATLERAFHQRGSITLTESVDGAWRPWHFDGLTDDQRPGDGRPLTVGDYARRGVEMVTTLLSQWIREGTGAGARRAAALAALPRLEGLFEVVARAATAGACDGLARSLRDAAGAVRGVLAPLVDDDTARRLWVCLDLATTCLAGAIRDELTAPDADFARLDDEEFRAWLRRHGASEEAIGSALVRGFYNLAFSHDDGAGAGTALLGITRMCLGWRGAIYYEMAAGMGETIFAPLYLALRRRGVRFEFFHRVKGLGVSRDGRRVDRVVVGRQATVRDGAPYDPLIDVKGLPCWPESPGYDQLVEGERLRAHGHRFSSLAETWPDVAERSLLEGKDFDRVVLAISHGALAPLCGELAACAPRWRAMLDGVRSTGTLAMQLWMRRDLRGLGWRRAAPPVLGSYAQPYDTWADLSHLLPRERWSPDDGVGHVAYLCGALGPAAETHLDFDEAQRRAWSMSVDWIHRHATGLFPACADDRGGFDWSVLHDPADRVGEQRLRAQYVRANTEGSERYVLFVAGTTKLRLPADDTGFDNLSIAGDWTRTGLDAGCVEAAAMSGLQAARGITGEDVVIPGEAPLFRARRRHPRRRDDALPRYIDRPDEMAVRAPYGMRGVTLHAWPVRADGAATQRLVDRYLNAPSDDALRVRVSAPWVFVVAAFLDAVGSIDTAHRHRGVMSEVDVGVWVPVTWQRRGVTRRGWYLPWIFVDSGPATVSGREIFGFPKNVAAMTTTRDGHGLASLDVQCPVMPRQGVGEVGRVDSVLRATRVDGDRPRAVRVPGAPWLRGSVPMIFLKQFRDLAAPDRACYQAVVEADARPTAVRSWGADTSDWRLDWGDAASHPIAAELGVARRCEVGGAVVASFDFEMDAGQVLFERAATNRGVAPREREPVIVRPHALGVAL
jgi:uncharacterized protein with NAD-binding domain and iron-sulfur cluster